MDNVKVEDGFAQTSQEFSEFNAKMKDPLVVGAMLHKLTVERENSNRLMMEISAKLDKIMQLEQKVNKLQHIIETSKETQQTTKQPQVILAEIDEKIIDFIRKHEGKTCASQIQHEFNYKGKNAASSRLHSLYQNGLLEKVQAGKTVYYLLKNESRVTGVLEGKPTN